MPVLQGQAALEQGRLGGNMYCALCKEPTDDDTVCRMCRESAWRSSKPLPSEEEEDAITEDHWNNLMLKKMKKAKPTEESQAQDEDHEESQAQDEDQPTCESCNEPFEGGYRNCEDCRNS